MSLANDSVKDRYGDLLTVGTSNGGITTTKQDLKDGTGTSSVISLSDDQIEIKPKNDNTTTTLDVKNTSGTSLLSVDTTNSEVVLNGNKANTGCFMFSCFNQSLDTNTWTSMMFGTTSSVGTVLNTFGTGSTPSTTLDASAESEDYAVMNMLHLPYDITIESVYIWYCGDNSSSDNIQFSLNAFSVATSGAGSGDLSSGAVLYSTTASAYDNTKCYYETLSATTNNVDAGKVLLFLSRSASTNNDLYARAYIKYHIK